MEELIIVAGGIYGALAVILGAFGAHALKSKFTAEQLKNYETGIKYQMYHALLLIICGINLAFDSTLQQFMGWSLILGVFFFSFSIYGLSLSAAFGTKMRWLGPVTPLGGLLLVIGWILFILNASELALL
jgi:uncharacterized membrane protein YgdD (TMEM256/DUF423 family)